MVKANKDKIRALLKSIETGDTDATAVVNEAKYIQHNPQTHEGSEGLAALFKRLSLTSPRVNIVRAFEDGDFVFAHTEYDFASRRIGFEIFRFEDGQAVEHWDNIQPRMGPNISSRSMVDGPTESARLDQTEANRTLVSHFVKTVLVGKETAGLADYVDMDAFAEHSPGYADDLQALRHDLETEKDGNRIIDYHKIHRILAEGDFVLCVSEGNKNGQHSAFFDLFRVADSKIVEHWDTVEKIAPRSEWKNKNGKF